MGSGVEHQLVGGAAGDLGGAVDGDGARLARSVAMRLGGGGGRVGRAPASSVRPARRRGAGRGAVAESHAQRVVPVGDQRALAVGRRERDAAAALAAGPDPRRCWCRSAACGDAGQRRAARARCPARPCRRTGRGSAVSTELTRSSGRDRRQLRRAPRARRATTSSPDRRRLRAPRPPLRSGDRCCLRPAWPQRDASRAESALSVGDGRRPTRSVAAMARVLVVDDEPGVRTAWPAGWPPRAWRSVAVADGPSAPAAPRSTGSFDAVVLDIILPGLSGYRVLEPLRAAGVDTPVLLLSAKDGEVDQADGLDLGADGYLVKPFSFVVLVAQLRAMLRRRDARGRTGQRVAARRAESSTRWPGR